MKNEEIKKLIKLEITNKLKKFNEIISLTFVGSFVDKKDLDGISDIDTIVICNSLSESLFIKCLKEINTINLKECGLENYTLKINPTFGPLKFDKKNVAVIHFMIYDIDLHIRHVLASPFTCYDWERSTVSKGVKLSDIFPVGKLQFRDFLEARRSLENYISDLNKRMISYREYSFKNNNPKEVTKSFSLDYRHVGEYAFHIIKNLISNYLKLTNDTNKSFSILEIKTEINRLLKSNSKEHSKKFDELNILKSKRAKKFPENTEKWAQSFLKDFHISIKNEWKRSIPIRFYRHLETEMNDGKFLGQRRDPPIKKNNKKYNEKNASIIYSSPMRRCKDTVGQLWRKANFIVDNNLTEIDYGFAEGISYKELELKYPDITQSWKLGKDPNFPNGESTKDVLSRLNQFLNNIKNEIDNKNLKSICVVSHNVFLRTLIGSGYNLPQKKWYRLNIPHGVALEFLYWNNNFSPNISRKDLSNIFADLSML